MNIQDHAFFCPQCSAATVDYSPLGGAASCNSCQWKGDSKELVSYSFQHDLGSSQEVLSAFTNDFKRFMAEHMAVPLGRILIKWGFFPGALNHKDLARYIGVTANACIVALLKERAAIEKERVKDGN